MAKTDAVATDYVLIDEVVRKLNLKQRRYCELRAQGVLMTHAAKQAGFKGKNTYAALNANPNVQAYISFLQEQAMQASVATVAEVLEFNTRIMRGVEFDQDTGAAPDLKLRIEAGDRLLKIHTANEDLKREEAKLKIKLLEKELAAGESRDNVQIVMDIPLIEEKPDFVLSTDE
jgi:phage terminase small subunit